MESGMVIVLEKWIILVYTTRSGKNNVFLKMARVRGMSLFKTPSQRKRKILETF